MRATFYAKEHPKEAKRVAVMDEASVFGGLWFTAGVRCESGYASAAALSSKNMTILKSLWELQQLSERNFAAMEARLDFFESQTNWQPKSFGSVWITHQLTTKSLESKNNWQPNDLRLKSFNIQITWIPNQLTTKIVWISNQMTSIPHQSTAKARESHTKWQPNHSNRKSTSSHIPLNLTSTDNQSSGSANQLTTALIWLSIRLNLTLIDSWTIWTLPIGSLWLETSAAASCGRYVISNSLGWWRKFLKACFADKTRNAAHWQHRRSARGPRSFLRTMMFM